MHRISRQSGETSIEQIELVEQPTAPVIFLSSASTDINAISESLKLTINQNLRGKITATLISDLDHPAQIDHYLATTTSKAKIIIVRLLGGRSYWPYGLEKLVLWKESSSNRDLIILSGVTDNENEIQQLSSLKKDTVDHLAKLIRSGGIDNINTFLLLVSDLLNKKIISLKKYKLYPFPEIKKWDWKNENGQKIGIILYNSLLKANDLRLAITINRLIRNKGMAPKLVWINSLRNKDIHTQIIRFFQEENVETILTATSFSSSKYIYGEQKCDIWDQLDVPVFQMLTSTGSRESWQLSSIGLNPIDLTLQIVMPEVDGIITTRPCAFKETSSINKSLNTAIKYLDPIESNLNWVIDHARNWIKLRHLKNKDKKITIILANYPIKDGRIANGVGLDTPESLLVILKSLEENGYYLGKKQIPTNSIDLIFEILQGRTNDPESNCKPPLEYLSLKEYLEWWNTLNEEIKNKVINRWGIPSKAIDLEVSGFSIHGIKYGNISILIQPSRGYDSESISDLHSPDLAPPHRYLAQYLWIESVFKSNAIIHLGKHGSVEWLPGKGVGLSDNCFPHITLPSLPNIYPFIVNDPGEGSQAKRRTQALIIDHLTPPLGRAGLYGNLLHLESLIDEYHESKLLSSSRTEIIKSNLINLINKEELPFENFNKLSEQVNTNDFESTCENLESYLCEIKDSQIRTGLHILGRIPVNKELKNLILSISRAPHLNYPGLTQLIASKLNLDFDPWSDNENMKPSLNDSTIIENILGNKPRTTKVILDYIESQAILIVDIIIKNDISNNFTSLKNLLNPNLIEIFSDNESNSLIKYINDKIINSIYISAKNELESIHKALNGQRVSSGPSGAPTRGRADVLPTGRNFFSVDIRGLPTEAAWDLGKRSAKNILDLYVLENGENLNHLAVSIWGTSTMRNGGEDICQVLSLMGIQPIWDFPTKRVVDLEIIPLSILNRPRVDVLVRISGLFRDTFPQLISLLNKAYKKLSLLNEPQNLNPYILNDSSKTEINRIYGSAPGAYGAGLQEMISSSAWESKNDLVESYLQWSKWSYSDIDNIQVDRKGLEEFLSKTQVVIHNQDNKEHDILDSDDYYQFQGGLSAAVEQLSERSPTILVSDHSRYSRPRVNKLEKEIDKVVRSRLLNPKWIKGMHRHGYKGAFEIGASIDYLFGYDATTNVVPDKTYNSIYKTFLEEKLNREFIINNNPWVMRDIAERLLEAYNRKLWISVDKLTLEDIKKLVIESDSIIENYSKN